MPRIPCPEPHCDFQTTDAGDAVAAVLLNHHLVRTHRVELTPPPAHAAPSHAGDSAPAAPGPLSTVQLPPPSASSTVPYAKTVWVYNISDSVLTTTLHTIFSSRGGTVTNIERSSQGFALVTFAEVEEAEAVVAACNRKLLNGKFLQVSMAKREPPVSDWLYFCDTNHVSLC